MLAGERRRERGSAATTVSVSERDAWARWYPPFSLSGSPRALSPLLSLPSLWLLLARPLSFLPSFLGERER